MSPAFSESNAGSSQPATGKSSQPRSQWLHRVETRQPFHPILICWHALFLTYHIFLGEFSVVSGVLHPPHPMIFLRSYEVPSLLRFRLLQSSPDSRISGVLSRIQILSSPC